MKKNNKTKSLRKRQTIKKKELKQTQEKPEKKVITCND